jgi:hypothetical protein
MSAFWLWLAVFLMVLGAMTIACALRERRRWRKETNK